MILLNDIRPEPIFEINPPQNTDIWAQSRPFKDGQRYLITAASGKGKSTLLHLIYGLRQDYAGDLRWNDEDTRSFNADRWADLRKQEIAIVFQDLRLFPQLTAFDNIRIKLELHQHKTEAEVRAMAERLGVDHLLDTTCEKLSYGQRQRFAIIRAMCQPFKWLLLDEPFSHLDQQNIEMASQLINEEVDQQQAGLILVSLGERYPIKIDETLVL